MRYGSFVLPSAMLLVLCQGCRDAAPSRDDVARMLTAELPSHRTSKEYALGVYTIDQEGRDVDGYSDWLFDLAPRRDAKEWLSAMARAGLISAQPPTPAYRWNRPRLFWPFAPTAAAQQYVVSSQRKKGADGLEYPFVEAIVAVPELVEVTGITAPSGASASSVRANFRYRWATTPFGNALKNLDPRLPSTGTQDASVIVLRYDDGWRLETLEL